MLERSDEDLPGPSASDALPGGESPGGDDDRGARRLSLRKGDVQHCVPCVRKVAYPTRQTA
jgi:hypothetical protein